MIKLSDECLIDTVSNLAVVDNPNYLSKLSSVEISKLIKDIEDEGIRYFVPDNGPPNFKAVCVREGVSVKTPGTYYVSWDKVPVESK